MAILLIIALLVIVGIYYIWITVQTKAGNAIFIQVVTFEQAKTKIYVQNVGNGTVTVDSVQISDQTFIIQPTNCKVASHATTTLQQGQTAEITINQAYTERVYIKVFCKEGTFNENWYEPPST